jgi:hypothetical protein
MEEHGGAHRMKGKRENRFEKRERNSRGRKSKQTNKIRVRQK